MKNIQPTEYEVEKGINWYITKEQITFLQHLMTSCPINLAKEYPHEFLDIPEELEQLRLELIDQESK
ncbi:hypothetical protein SAMN04487866_13220 [Thermoactinomyces sp. DSM 45891]|uniref:hypothetical protein n=1 Tax=Thermoactinomyces sp. DSM 45891 TaxID=1761907 RepID=UPI000917E1BC|nr:hypothetical protein [Thermoactinomyces sp. DSM 45891]SFX82676.1 hypothetical protein SAMN04487866_13220 [Thermoactinomyces sp. DSM 45891]